MLSNERVVLSELSQCSILSGSSSGFLTASLGWHVLRSMLKHGVVQKIVGDTKGLTNSPTHTLAPWRPGIVGGNAKWPPRPESGRGSRNMNRDARVLPGIKDSSTSIIAVESGSTEDELTADIVAAVDSFSSPVTAQRIQYLEKSIEFLKTQHQELVACLHEEVERLKRKNKELQFCVVMMQQRNLPSNVKRKPDTDLKNETSKADGVKNDSSKIESSGEASNIINTDATNVGREEARGDGPQRHSLNYEKMEDLRVLFHEEEVKELKLLLESEREQNRHLVELLRKSRLQTSSDKTNISKALSMKRHPPVGEVSADPLHPTPKECDNSVDEVTLPYGATLEPLLVNVPPLGPRPPMLRECQGIVRHLQQTIDRQAHELNQLKTDLRDVLYSHKWTPDAFLLARAYIADDDAEETESGTSPTRVPMKHATRRIPDGGYISKDTLSLPPIKNSVGNQSIERQKRVQSLQKTRAINHFTTS